MIENNAPYERGEGWKQLIIARKDLNMSPGKLAAQVSHGSMAWLTNMIKENAVYYNNRTCYPVYGIGDQICYADGIIAYREDLYELAKQAAARGEDKFYAEWDGATSSFVSAPPQAGYYAAELYIDSDVYEGWIEGSFTKVICEARNRNQLLKACALADELGLKEGKDYFLIKDNCYTELEPEEVDENGVGRTLTVVGFRPLEASMCEKISRKFQLYK